MVNDFRRGELLEDPSRSAELIVRGRRRRIYVGGIAGSAFRKVEFQESPCPAVADGTLSAGGLSRILVLRHPSCPSNQARSRLKETRGDRLNPDRDNKRGAGRVPFRFHVFFVLRESEGSRAEKTRPQIGGSTATPFLASLRSPYLPAWR